jgi:hypothetical protein
MASDENYTNVLLEEIRDQNRAVLELVGQMRGQMNGLATEDSLQEVADDVKTVKAVLTDTNKDLKELDGRVTLLEQAA